MADDNLRFNWREDLYNLAVRSGTDTDDSFPVQVAWMLMQILNPEELQDTIDTLRTIM
jgi:hypothetical protein